MKHMNKKQIYATKDIFIAHITTINPDLSTKWKVIQSSLALKQVKIKKRKILLPVEQFFPYYSIDEVFPISTKMKRTSRFISNHEIRTIVENEKYLQMQQRLDLTKENTTSSTQKNNKRMTITEQFEQIEKNENPKVKKLVA